MTLILDIDTVPPNLETESKMTLILDIDTVPPNLEAKSWISSMISSVTGEIYIKCASGGLELTIEQFCKIVRDYLYVDDSRPHNEGAEFCGEITPNVSIFQKDGIAIYFDNKLWVIIGPKDFFYLTHYVFTNTNLAVNDTREQLINELIAAGRAIRPEASELYQWLTTRVIVEGWPQYPYVPGRRYDF